MILNYQLSKYQYRIVLYVMGRLTGLVANREVASSIPHPFTILKVGYFWKGVHPAS